MKANTIHNNPKQQAGTVLAVSLTILLVLTIIGVSSLSTSSLQEKITGNFRDREVAFQAAEAALAYAENYANTNINDVATIFTSTSATKSSAYYDQYEGPTSKNALDAAWWATPGTTCEEVSDTNTPPEVNTNACYIIEWRGQFGEEEKKDPNLKKKKKAKTKIDSFRITVRATGMSDNTWVVLQSHYGKALF